MKKQILFFVAELLAVAVLRAIYMIRRDRKLPKSSKVRRVKGRPVYSVAGWTPPPRKAKLHDTPDGSPDA